MQNNESRNSTLSFLRIIATIAVIILHVCSDLLYNFNNLNNWWLGNIVDSSVRWCVPVFLMMTGTLFIPSTQPLNIFYKKRIIKVIIPYLIWSSIYFIINSKINPKGIVDIKQIIIYGTSYHFWYINLIVGIYFFLPMINKTIMKINYTSKVILSIIFITSLIVPLFWSLKFPYSIVTFFSYFGITIWGYFLFHSKYSNKTGIICFLAGTVCIIYGTYYMSLNQLNFDSRFYQYTNFFVVLQASGIVILGKNLMSENEFIKNNKFLMFLDYNSYPIYIIHVLMLTLLNFIDFNMLPKVAEILVTVLICLSMSISLIKILRILPYSKYILGIT